MQRRMFLVLAAGGLMAACTSDEQMTTGVDGNGGLDQNNGNSLDVEGLNTLDGSGGLPQPNMEWVRQTYGDTVLFDYDSSALNPAADQVVRQWGDWMRQFPAISVVIQGHCDERGTREYNLALGDRRANAVRNVLLALGIAPDRVGTISFGKERPVVSGHDEATWAKNRRAVLTIA